MRERPTLLSWRVIDESACNYMLMPRCFYGVDADGMHLDGVRSSSLVSKGGLCLCDVSRPSCYFLHSDINTLGGCRPFGYCYANARVLRWELGCPCKGPFIPSLL